MTGSPTHHRGTGGFAGELAGHGAGGPEGGDDVRVAVAVDIARDAYVLEAFDHGLARQVVDRAVIGRDGTWEAAPGVGEVVRDAVAESSGHEGFAWRADQDIRALGPVARARAERLGSEVRSHHRGAEVGIWCGAQIEGCARCGAQTQRAGVIDVCDSVVGVVAVAGGGCAIRAYPDLGVAVAVGAHRDWRGSFRRTNKGSRPSRRSSADCSRCFHGGCWGSCRSWH